MLHRMYGPCAIDGHVQLGVHRVRNSSNVVIVASRTVVCIKNSRETVVDVIVVPDECLMCESAGND